MKKVGFVLVGVMSLLTGINASAEDYMIEDNFKVSGIVDVLMGVDGSDSFVNVTGDISYQRFEKEEKGIGIELNLKMDNQEDVLNYAWYAYGGEDRFKVYYKSVDGWDVLDVNAEEVLSSGITYEDIISLVDSADENGNVELSRVLSLWGMGTDEDSERRLKVSEKRNQDDLLEGVELSTLDGEGVGVELEKGLHIVLKDSKAIFTFSYDEDFTVPEEVINEAEENKSQRVISEMLGE